MSEPFLGQIMPVGFGFAPRGWALCNGQLLSISQNSALFSLLGTTFGGDGRTTFGLPDLRGRYARHVGSGPGLDSVSWGEKAGSFQHSLTVQQMPSHNHVLRASTNGADTTDPSNAVLAEAREDTFLAENPNTSMHPNSISNNGGGQAFNILNPYLGIYWCIALTGLFPSRN